MSTNKTIRKGKISKRPFVIFISFCATMLILILSSISSANEFSRSIEALNSNGITQSIQNADLLIASLNSREKEDEDEHKITKEDVTNVLTNNNLVSEKESSAYADSINAIPFFTEERALHQVKVKDKDDALQKRREEAFFAAIASKADAMSISDHSSNTYSKETIAHNSRTNFSPNTQNFTTLDSFNALNRDDFILHNKVQSINTKYLLSQGSVLPSILITGINSELPGQVTAQITRDVYDSPTGRFLLIPKGSRIMGQYNSSTHYGQERVMLGFNRIIFPDGKSLNLGTMPAIGSDGMSGIEADVNNHLISLVTSSILLGGISTSIALTQKGSYVNENNERTNRGIFTETMGQSLGTALSRVIERNLSISPTLEVKSGFPFNVTLTKDIEFDEEYRAYDY